MRYIVTIEFLRNNAKLNPEIGKGKFENLLEEIDDENAWKEGLDWTNWKFKD